MATTHRSDLVDELEKALRDEAYDGGMGSLSPEQFTDYVRGLAVTVAKVVEEARAPSAAERVALVNTINRALYNWDGEGDSAEFVGDVILAAGFRRPEAPETQGESSDALEMLAEADALVASWDRKGSWSSDSPVGTVMRLATAPRAAGGAR